MVLSVADLIEEERSWDPSGPLTHSRERIERLSPMDPSAPSDLDLGREMRDMLAVPLNWSPKPANMDLTVSKPYKEVSSCQPRLPFY